MGKYNKTQILEYLNLIGLDESEIKLDKDMIEKGIILNNISELYKKNDAGSILPKSSKEVGNAYEVIDGIVNDPFWYETKIERRNAHDYVFSILADLTDQIEVNDSDKDILFEKNNELIKTILLGLSECGDIPKFKFYIDNSTISSLVKKMNILDNPEDLNKLYGLCALTKLESFDGNKIFDENNKITEKNILEEIRKNLNSFVSMKGIDFEENHKLYKRKSLKELKK